MSNHLSHLVAAMVAATLANRRQGRLLPTLGISLPIGLVAVGPVHGASAEAAVPVYFGAPVVESSSRC